MSASLIRALAELTIAASVAILVVAAIRKPLRRVGGARVAYLCWLLVPASQLVVSVPAPVEPVEVAWQALPQWGARALAATVYADGVLADARVAATDYAALAVAVWAAGALAMLFVVVRRQRAFVRSLGVLEAMPDGTYRSARVREPLLLGAWRPRVVLPTDFESLYDADERALILAHERAHQHRRDAFVNGIATIWLCCSWFNPLMYWALARLRFDQELACDEVALAARSAQRRRYADALLRTQLAAEAALSAPLACPWHSRHPLEERIAILKRPVPTLVRRRSVAALTSAALGAVCYALWTMLPGAVYAQDGEQQTTVITADNITLGSSAHGARLTVMSPDYKSRLADGNNDFEVTRIHRLGEGHHNVVFRTRSDAVSTIAADHFVTVDGGVVELSGNVVVRFLPGPGGGPNNRIVLEKLDVTFEDGVRTRTTGGRIVFGSAELTTDRATLEENGTITMDSATVTFGRPRRGRAPPSAPAAIR